MIYLLRHGEILGSDEDRYIGQIDVPLSDKGREQAKWWRSKLSQIQFSEIFASDLSRAMETAEIVSGDGKTKIKTIPQLREIHLGAWEGESMERIKREFPREWKKRGERIDTYRTPGGESFLDLHKRVIPVFHDIIKQFDENILIVAHAGVNRVILCHVCGMPVRDLFDLDQGYGALNIIEKRRGQLHAKSLNLIPGKITSMNS